MMAAFLLSTLLAGNPVVATDIDERSIEELGSALRSGEITSAAIVARQVSRIDALNHAGPELNCVVTLNPQALRDAKSLDEERRQGKVRGRLHGVTFVIKDIIDVAGLPTTAGSLALVNNIAPADAGVVSRLRRAGAVVLAKASTSEWANGRTLQSVTSWSATGGLTRNPYVLDRTASGSSGGSAVAVAAGLTVAALGTDSDGSVLLPAAVNGIVGMRPTVGLVSRGGVIPFVRRQDTVGPMARYVADAAAILTVIAGSDPADPDTIAADGHKTDYSSMLRRDALKGVRLGVMRFATGGDADTASVFDQALRVLKEEGAVLVDIPKPPSAPQPPLTRPGAESHARYDHVLAGLAAAVPVRNLADLVAFNRTHASQELTLFGQERLEQALSEPAHAPSEESERKADAFRQEARDRVDAMLRDYGVGAMVAPSNAPAARVDIAVRGSTGSSALGLGVSSYAAQAGYPQITVPMGFVHNLPVGISLTGTAWSDDKLLAYAYAFEQATRARRPPKFLKSLEGSEDIVAAMAPQRP